MKKIVLFLLMLVPLGALAQEFYSANDITVSVRYWKNEYTFNYLIENGTKLNIGCLPNSNATITNYNTSTEILATFYRNGKFLILSFYKYYGESVMGIHTAYNAKNLKSDNDYLKYYMNESTKPWVKIDFDKIVYYSLFDYVMIPIGKDSNGDSYAICVSFNDTPDDVSSAKRDTESQDEAKSRYYDLSGIEVSRGDTKGKILIERKGTNSRKFYNK